MPKAEHKEFYNDGFGWICKHCERETEAQKTDDDGGHSRLMSEGEAESKQPKFSNSGLAKWMDKAQTTLICPGCGATEKVDG